MSSKLLEFALKKGSTNEASEVNRRADPINHPYVVTEPIEKKARQDRMVIDTSELGKAFDFEPSFELFKCEECGKSLRAKATLESHIKAKHTHQKEFKCTFCEYTAVQKGHIAVHMSGMHNKIEKFQCNICSYLIERKWDIGKHFKQDHKDAVSTRSSGYTNLYKAVFVTFIEP